MGFVGVKKVQGEPSRCGLAVACECWGLESDCCDPRQKAEWGLPVKNAMRWVCGYCSRLDLLPDFMSSHHESFSPGKTDRHCLGYFSFPFIL